MSKVDSLKTQRTETVHIGLDTGKAYGSFQWLLENSLSHPIRNGNTMQLFICGKEGFEHIAADIEQAKESIDLVCWGFDPGMALVRGAGNSKFPWAHGEPYGELLKRKAGQGVRVRLLVWYSDKASAKQNALVGYVNPDEFMVGGVINRTNAELVAINQATAQGLSGGWVQVGNAPRLSVIEQRLDYCTQWWREASSGQIPNLEIRCRKGDTPKVKVSIADEADKPSAADGEYGGLANEKMLLEEQTTHHQKPILIDYGYQDGKSAVGYVMGLNSITDYWDTDEHEWDQALRELDSQGTSDAAAAAALKQGKPLSRKPLRDYAARLEGAILRDVYKNFATAWNRAGLLPKLVGPGNAKSHAVRGANLNENLLPAALAKTGSDDKKLRLQLLRTQPEEAYDDVNQCWSFDKSIKHGYFQASSFARSYIYLENQYFFYEEWARHLKANRAAFMDWVEGAGKSNKDARLLHLMAVIPVPEDAGMVPRTYDTLKSLGQADSMPNQNKEIQTRASGKPGNINEITRTALKVKAPTLNKEGVLMQDGKSLGLKVLVAKLVTENKGARKGLGRFRDVYIHSKLLMIDDCYLTLGSANLNLRSMAADSEINVATDSIPHCQAFRERIWNSLTGGDREGTCAGPIDKQRVALAFKRWQTLAAQNKDAVDRPEKQQSIVGHLVQFEDTRVSNHRYG